MNLKHNADSKTIELLLALGLAYLEKGEHHRAVEKFNILADLNIENSEIVRSHALALARAGLIDNQSLGVYKKVVAETATDQTLYLTLATLFLKENVVSPPALTVFLRALKFSPPFENEIRIALEKIFYETGEAVSILEIRDALLENRGQPDLLSLFLKGIWESKKYDAGIQILKEAHARSNQDSYKKAICETLLEKKAAADESDQHFNLTASEMETCIELKNIEEPLRQIADLEIYLDMKNLLTSLPSAIRKTTNDHDDEHSFLAGNEALNSLPEIAESSAGEFESEFNIVEDFLEKINRLNHKEAENSEAANENDVPSSVTANNLFLSKLNTIAIFEVLELGDKNEPSGQTCANSINLISGELISPDLILRKMEDGLIALASDSDNLLKKIVATLNQIERYNQVVEAPEAMKLRVTLHSSPAPFMESINHGLKEIRKAVKVHNTSLDDRIIPVVGNGLEPESSLFLVTDPIAERLNGFDFTRLGKIRLNHFHPQQTILQVNYNDRINKNESQRSPTAEQKQHIGKYEISDILKENQLWSTYRGYDALLDRQVIIKAYRAQAFAGFKEFTPLKKQFYEEIRKLNRINHRNIPVIYDAGEENDLLYLVREYIAGESLNKKLNSNGFTGVRNALGLYIQVCQILSNYHQNQLWHKNLKPDNIWIVNEEIKLVDGGLLQVRHTDRVWNDDIDSQSYVAPEQIQGLRITQSCDNFLLGIMLYESLTGLHPFDAKTASKVRIHILADDPPPASTIRPQISEKLNEILTRSLSKNPDKRYGSITDFAADLTKALHDEDSAQPESKEMLR